MYFWFHAGWVPWLSFVDVLSTCIVRLLRGCLSPQNHHHLRQISMIVGWCWHLWWHRSKLSRHGSLTMSYINLLNFFLFDIFCASKCLFNKLRHDIRELSSTAATRTINNVHCCELAITRKFNKATNCIPTVDRLTVEIFQRLTRGIFYSPSSITIFQVTNM